MSLLGSPLGGSASGPGPDPVASSSSDKARGQEPAAKQQEGVKKALKKEHVLQAAYQHEVLRAPITRNVTPINLKQTAAAAASAKEKEKTSEELLAEKKLGVITAMLRWNASKDAAKRPLASQAAAKELRELAHLAGSDYVHAEMAIERFIDGYPKIIEKLVNAKNRATQATESMPGRAFADKMAAEQAQKHAIEELLEPFLNISDPDQRIARPQVKAAVKKFGMAIGQEMIQEARRKRCGEPAVTFQHLPTPQEIARYANASPGSSEYREMEAFLSTMDQLSQALIPKDQSSSQYAINQFAQDVMNFLKPDKRFAAGDVARRVEILFRDAAGQNRPSFEQVVQMATGERQLPSAGEGDNRERLELNRKALFDNELQKIQAKYRFGSTVQEPPVEFDLSAVQESPLDTAASGLLPPPPLPVSHREEFGKEHAPAAPVFPEQYQQRGAEPGGEHKVTAAEQARREGREFEEKAAPMPPQPEPGAESKAYYSSATSSVHEPAARSADAGPLYSGTAQESLQQFQLEVMGPEGSYTQRFQNFLQMAESHLTLKPAPAPQPIKDTLRVAKKLERVAVQHLQFLLRQHSRMDPANPTDKQKLVYINAQIGKLEEQIALLRLVSGPEQNPYDHTHFLKVLTQRYFRHHPAHFAHVYTEYAYRRKINPGLTTQYWENPTTGEYRIDSSPPDPVTGWKKVSVAEFDRRAALVATTTSESFHDLNLLKTFREQLLKAAASYPKDESLRATLNKGAERLKEQIKLRTLAENLPGALAPGYSLWYQASSATYMASPTKPHGAGWEKKPTWLGLQELLRQRQHYSVEAVLRGDPIAMSIETAVQQLVKNPKEDRDLTSISEIEQYCKGLTNSEGSPEERINHEMAGLTHLLFQIEAELEVSPLALSEAGLDEHQIAQLRPQLEASAAYVKQRISLLLSRPDLGAVANRDVALRKMFGELAARRLADPQLDLAPLRQQWQMGDFTTDGASKRVAEDWDQALNEYLFVRDVIKKTPSNQVAKEIAGAYERALLDALPRFLAPLALFEEQMAGLRDAPGRYDPVLLESQWKLGEFTAGRVQEYVDATWYDALGQYMFLKTLLKRVPVPPNVSALVTQYEKALLQALPAKNDLQYGARNAVARMDAIAKGLSEGAVKQAQARPEAVRDVDVEEFEEFAARDPRAFQAQQQLSAVNIQRSIEMHERQFGEVQALIRGKGLEIAGQPVEWTAAELDTLVGFFANQRRLKTMLADAERVAGRHYVSETPNDARLRKEAEAEVKALKDLDARTAPTLAYLTRIASPSIRAALKPADKAFEQLAKQLSVLNAEAERSYKSVIQDIPHDPENVHFAVLEALTRQRRNKTLEQIIGGGDLNLVLHSYQILRQQGAKADPELFRELRDALLKADVPAIRKAEAAEAAARKEVADKQEADRKANLTAYRKAAEKLFDQAVREEAEIAEIPLNLDNYVSFATRRLQDVELEVEESSYAIIDRDLPRALIYYHVLCKSGDSRHSLIATQFEERLMKMKFSDAAVKLAEAEKSKAAAKLAEEEKAKAFQPAESRADILRRLEEERQKAAEKLRAAGAPSEKEKLAKAEEERIASDRALLKRRAEPTAAAEEAGKVKAQSEDVLSSYQKRAKEMYDTDIEMFGPESEEMLREAHLKQFSIPEYEVPTVEVVRRTVARDLRSAFITYHILRTSGMVLTPNQSDYLERLEQAILFFGRFP